MCPPRPSDNDPETLPPGAERFWGQFSEARAGRARNEEEPSPEDGEKDAGHHQGCLEWCPICRSAELLRGATSPDVREQIHAIQNEAVQVFKAFAAAYAERTSDDPFSRDRNPGTDEPQRSDRDDPGPAGKTFDISIE